VGKVVIQQFILKILHHVSRGGAMENFSYFYKAVTRIAEVRIQELLQPAKEAEAREDGFPEAGSYFRACAHTVYFAWRDITDGWHTEAEVERLESFIGLPICSDVS
jgi:hypothetical protein